MPFSQFHPVVKAWFEETLGKPSPPQAQGWPVIARGENALILAPTGSGKTLAAFLKCLDQLYQDGVKEGAGVQVLYVSPLKALNNDIHKNLDVPLRGIEAKALALGVNLPRLTTAVRTGDTSQKDRQAMVKRPPHVLITTPESLYLILTSKAREMLKTVRYVILDEIHAVCGTKRGVHLSLSLERLEAIAKQPPVRIGLSATQKPLEEIARYLGGVGRDVTIVDTGTRKQLDLRIELPVDDMRALPEGSIWPSVHTWILDHVLAHRSTLVFTNYRGLAEKIADKLNALCGGREIAKVHHGSMSREAREQVEADLKEGRLPCLVATSSLELGIDVGAIDLVIQVESPKSVARGLQRVGRAGHIIGAASKGRLVPKLRSDLLEMACIVREMNRGDVEETHVPTGALDVLAQQVTAMAAVDDWKIDDLLALCRRSYCYRDLSERQLNTVLEMLSGRYPSEEFRDLRPRIVWDKEEGVIRGREGAKMLAIRSGGTIPDRGYYGVYIHGTNVKLGDMDEEFVYESRVGDIFLLGTASWRIQAIEHNRITVTEGMSTYVRMPFWKGDGLGRPFEMGLKLGAFVRELQPRLEDPALEPWLQEQCCMDVGAARNIRAYLADQLEAAGALPHDRMITAEYFWDELGDRRIVIHSPFGGRTHQAWQIVLKVRIRELMGLDAEIIQNDDGILIRVPGADVPPPVEKLLRIDPGEAREMLLEEVGNTPVFGAFFRMNAGRAMVLPRPMAGKRQPFWLQRLRASDLLQVARKYDSFPVVLETYREVLQDVLDMNGLQQLLLGLQTGEIGLHIAETEVPSPYASTLMMGFVGAYMYEGEMPRAERKGALLGLNRDLLREILGAEKLRDLLDPRAIADVSARVQRLDPAWFPRGVDDTDDLLRRLGDLSSPELIARGVDMAWVYALEAQRRAVRLLINGEPRWVASDDRGLYSDLAGHAGAVIRRFARNQVPFVPENLMSRYGYDRDTVLRYLDVLRAEGLLAAGEYTQGVTDREYCEVEILQQIHRQTLSLLRKEIEPVDGPTFARFLMEWQGVGAAPGKAPARGTIPHTLRRALEKLQGVPLPVESWERDVLPARAPGYQPLWLDQLCATGELHWAAAPGGKLAFYPPERMGAFSSRLLAEPAAELDPTQAKVLKALQQTGADFLGGIARAAGLTPPDALEALWQLAREGLVTNDTYAPVRQVLRTAKAAVKKGGRPMPLQGGTGRWSLTSKLMPPDAGEESPADTYTRILLERYGVVTREAVQSEDGPVTWPEVLAVLKRLELKGQVRRGYFIKDLSGAQFALPDAVERLRGARETAAGHLRLLAAVDPANPYGSILGLPGGGRVSRLASVYLVLEDGRPVLAVEGGGRRLVPLEELEGERLVAVLGALKELLAGPRQAGSLRRVEIEFWGDMPILESDVLAPLQALGFERTPSRLVLYR